MENRAELQRTEPRPEILLVDASNLNALRARPSLKEYLSSLWKNRYFIASDARARSFSTGRGMFLGAAWIVLNPAIQVALYAFVFGFILKVDRGMENFIGFLIIGVILFGFISGGLGAGVRLIQGNRGLLKSFNFPKATVAIAKGLKSSVDNLPALILAVLAALASQYWITPSWTALFILPLYVLMQFFLTGIILIVARLTAFVPDLGSLVNVITRILFFTSGVFWPIDRFIHDPAIAQVVMGNPCYQFLDVARQLVLYGTMPGWQTWGALALWSIGAFIIGIVFFWRAEHRYAAIK